MPKFPVRAVVVRGDEDPFRRVFLSSADAIVLLNPAVNSTLDVNPQASRTFGYSHQEFLRLAPKRFLCTKKGQWELLLDSVRNRRGKWIRGMECRGKSGRTGLVRDLLPSVVSVNGQACVLAMVRDAARHALVERLHNHARLMRITNAVAAGAAAAPSAEHAVRFCMRQVCRHAHSVFAHTHIFAGALPGVRIPADIWYFGPHHATESLRRMATQERQGFAEEWYSLVRSQARPFIVSDLQFELYFPKELAAEMKSAFVAPIVAGTEVIGLTQYFSAEPVQSDQLFLEILGCMGNTLGISMEHKRLDERVRTLSARLFHVQDNERRRLAGELHDTTAQNLIAILMDLDTIGRKESALEPDARSALSECVSLAQQSLFEIRTFSYLLYPPMLDQLGLVPALRTYIEGFSQRSGMRVHLDIPEPFPRLPSELEITLFRVMQEGLTNAHRHSGRATEVRIRPGASEIKLCIENEIAPGTVSDKTAAASVAHGVGMANMRDRVQRLGGRLTLQTGKDQIVLEAVFPLARAAKGAGAS